MIFNHPIYKKAYLHHEIEQIVTTFCQRIGVSQVVVQIVLKTDKIVLTLKTSSSGEATALMLAKSELFEELERVLTEKKLWAGKELCLGVRLK